MPVTAGTQTVVLTYAPPWLRVGLVISILAHIVLGAVIAWAFWRTRKTT